MIIRAHSFDLFSLKANDFMYFTHSVIQNMCIPSNWNMAKDSVILSRVKQFSPFSPLYEMLVACLA